MEDRKNGHSVTLEDRENISITGVNEVISFDEESISAETEMGVLMIKGEGLHVIKLDLERGFLSVEGEITSLDYTEGSLGRNSFLSRIFK